MSSIGACFGFCSCIPSKYPGSQSFVTGLYMRREQSQDIETTLGRTGKYRFPWRPVFTYNSRLQMNQAWAAVNNNGNNWLLYFNFGYGSTNNNGNLLGVNEQVGNSVPWGLDDAVQPELPTTI